MNTTPNYLNEFTPDWPHGHVALWLNGFVKPFVVKVTDGPGEFPIWGYVVGEDDVWRFRVDGTYRSNSDCLLRNAAPPKREPREVWVNLYPNRGRSVILDSRELADELATPRRIECVHFREVIGEAEALV